MEEKFEECIKLLDNYKIEYINNELLIVYFKNKKEKKDIKNKLSNCLEDYKYLFQNFERSNKKGIKVKFLNT